LVVSSGTDADYGQICGNTPDRFWGMEPVASGLMGPDFDEKGAEYLASGGSLGSIRQLDPRMHRNAAMPGK
jgi:hypothetical protein